jgi:hypothetical protein
VSSDGIFLLIELTEMVMEYNKNVSSSLIQGELLMILRTTDRTTRTGQMIDEFLRSQIELDDHVIHLLFSANRWEAA